MPWWSFAAAGFRRTSANTSVRPSIYLVSTQQALDAINRSKYAPCTVTFGLFRFRFVAFVHHVSLGLGKMVVGKSTSQRSTGRCR